LEKAGALAPHTGLPFTEGLLLGLGGGVGAGCFAFDCAGRPCLRVGFRHRWEDDLRFVTDVLRRLSARTIVLEAQGPAGAEKCLLRLLGEGRPALAWVASGAGPRERAVVVTGLDGADALLFDPASESGRISRAELALARNALPSHRNRLIALESPLVAGDLAGAVLEATRACAGRLLQPPVPELGLEALRRVPPGHPRIPEGGGLRALYAGFLAEAAALTGRGALLAVAARYRELADAWSRTADPATLYEAERQAALHLHEAAAE
jgi:hypothetical protein